MERQSSNGFPVLLLSANLLFVTSPAFASSAYDLAYEPEAVVDEQGICHITGAIWSTGPVRNAVMVLKEQGTGVLHEATTDRDGIYRIAIPVDGRTVFQETDIGRRGWAGSRPKAYCIRARVEVGEIVPVSDAVTKLGVPRP